MTDTATDTATEMTNGAATTVSIVIPLYNEQDNVQPLVDKVMDALDGFESQWELILVNDGSRDQTYERLQALSVEHAFLHPIHLQRNFGQTAAMQAGIDAARGEVIVTLDGDLQNDPVDIPRMVRRLIRDDLDLVAGWRKNRKDGLWLRKIPSRIANRLIGKITGVKLNDYGCSLKAFRAKVLKSITLFGEMHRFIPAWLATETHPDRIKEEVVTHHPRIHGESKYGLSRTFRVIIDLLFMYFYMRFRGRPGHFFGQAGLVSGGLGGLGLFYLFVIKLMGEDIGTRPLLIVSVMLVILGVQLILTGVLAELITRIYYSASDRKFYTVMNADDTKPAAEKGWQASNLSGSRTAPFDTHAPSQSD
ncbi:MAG: glycosyltransferase family 2 protein [Hydrogenovibrio sp.]|uniref:glycosyltransferase family 2 protein n=1 Tax=Hydrogenovibrio TaxID=28884 RepID=UPI000367985F|nr:MULTISPECIES: glycosyltransferase family 2 protein [Hydrogenovibrio]MDR9498476.1 glycosyltransferase family 2 protein [Hydrogenovibrio sp.]